MCPLGFVVVGICVGLACTQAPALSPTEDRGAGTSSTSDGGAAGSGLSDAAGNAPAIAGSAGMTADTGGGAGAKADPATLGRLQSWMGTVEGFSFHSGSDALALTFAADANGVSKGTIVFGMGTPPPPATDPNVGYPSDLLTSTGYFGPDPYSGLALSYVAEGYPYTFDGGSFDGRRLHFTTNLFELWAHWCALQTPAFDGFQYNCLPPWYGGGPGACNVVNRETSQVIPVDCGQFLLCEGNAGPCGCGSSGCGLSSIYNGVTVNISVTGDTASGSISGSIFGPDNVHLVKN
jgi:hypothetical protein